MTAPKLCQQCNERPVVRKPHARFCQPCTDAIYAPQPDDGFDLFGAITKNHSPIGFGAFRS